MSQQPHFHTYRHIDEIAYITNHFNIGVVSEDFTAEGMANALNKLTMDQVNQFKQNSDEAAKKLSSDNNKSLLLKTLQEII